MPRARKHLVTRSEDLPALEYLIRTAGTDKVLMGSDYPFDVMDSDPVETVNLLESISFTEKKKIWGENAAQLLGLSDEKDAGTPNQAKPPHPSLSRQGRD